MTRALPQKAHEFAKDRATVPTCLFPFQIHILWHLILQSKELIIRQQTVSNNEELWQQLLDSLIVTHDHYESEVNTTFMAGTAEVAPFRPH